jgi:hypothetical protein
MPTAIRIRPALTTGFVPTHRIADTDSGEATSSGRADSDAQAGDLGLVIKAGLVQRAT